MMQEELKEQEIPVKVYRTQDRLMVVAPLPGLEPENIQVEVTADGYLIIRGELRGALKDVKELLIDEWSIGGYHRKLLLPTAVNAESANLSYGNGVLAIAFPIAEQVKPAMLTLARVAPAHGQRWGNAGHPPTDDAV
ncbi:MAG: Hsp20/alpha crystallin family protein [Ktedonobacteraceae bacterium]